MPPASCRELALELACDYLEGKLDGETVRELDAHMEQCPNCHAFLKTYCKTASVARATLRTDIPESCTQLLMEFLDQRLPPR